MQRNFVCLDKPRCIHSSPLNVPVSESSSNLIPCDIDGIPKATTYRWILNTTGKEETLRQTTPTLTLRQKKIQFPEDKKIIQYAIVILRYHYAIFIFYMGRTAAN